MKREGARAGDPARRLGGVPIRRQRIRAAFAAAIVVSLFAGLIARLYFIQVLGLDDLRRLGRAHAMRDVAREVRRGGILDVRRQAIAASLYRDPASAEIAVDPLILAACGPEARASTILDLASILGLPRERAQDLVARCADAPAAGIRYLRIVDGPVEPERAEEVRGYVAAWEPLRGTKDWARGILVSRTRDRVYCDRGPAAGSYEGMLASIAGGLDRYGTVGVSGIERLYDRWLRGQGGRHREETGPGAYPRFVSVHEPFIPSIQPYDVILTIDLRLQKIAVDALSDAVLKEFRAKRGAVVILDPHRGDILAIANCGEGGVPADENFGLTLLYEPGSVMKPFVAAEALARGVVRTGAGPIWTGGRVRIASNGRQIVDHKNLSPVTFEKGLTLSSNIVFSILGERLGRRGCESLLHRFGFDRAPGIARRLCPAFIPWRKTSWTHVYSEQSIGYGYELLTTPLSLARAFAVFANGGWLVEPRLVDRLERIGADGRPETIPGDPVRRERAIPESRVREVMRDLLAEVAISGTAQKLAIPGISMGAKTGTTKKWVNGSYGGGHYYSTFICFVPVEDPKYVIFSMIDEPKGAYYGSQVAGPVAARIVRALAIGEDDAP